MTFVKDIAQKRDAINSLLAFGESKQKVFRSCRKTIDMELTLRRGLDSREIGTYMA